MAKQFIPFPSLPVSLGTNWDSMRMMGPTFTHGPTVDLVEASNSLQKKSIQLQAFGWPKFPIDDDDDDDYYYSDYVYAYVYIPSELTEVPTVPNFAVWFAAEEPPSKAEEPLDASTSASTALDTDGGTASGGPGRPGMQDCVKFSCMKLL